MEERGVVVRVQEQNVLRTSRLAGCAFDVGQQLYLDALELDKARYRRLEDAEATRPGDFLWITWPPTPLPEGWSNNVHVGSLRAAIAHEQQRSPSDFAVLRLVEAE